PFPPRPLAASTSFPSTTLFRSGGNDFIISKANAKSTFYGGDGNDVIFGAQAGEVILGGEGADNIEAGDGEDSIDGGGGSDYLKGDRKSTRLNSSHVKLSYAVFC